MIRTWFYILAPLWLVEWATKTINPMWITMAYEIWGIRVWKKKDGTEIWICRRNSKSKRSDHNA